LGPVGEREAMTEVPIQIADQRPAGRKRWFVVAAVLVVVLVAVAALWRHYAQAQGDALIAVTPGALAGWNVLLVSIDTLRADRVGCYGYAAAARAREGLARCSTAPATTRSRPASSRQTR